MMKESKSLFRKGFGRPPAPWVFDLAELEGNNHGLLNYDELCEKFGVGKRRMSQFCSQHEIPSFFERSDNGAIVKKFKLSDLAKAAKVYVEERGYIRGTDGTSTNN